MVSSAYMLLTAAVGCVNIFGMGMSLANLSVKAPYDQVKQCMVGTKPAGTEAYISEGINGYTNLFTDKESFEFVSELASRLSQKLETISMCGEVYDSDAIHVAFYSVGNMVFEYDWPEYEQEAPTIKGSWDDLFRVFGFFGNSKEDYIKKLGERFYAAEDRYVDIIVPLGLSYGLRQTGFHYIEVESEECGLNRYNKNPEHFKVEKI